MRAVRDIDAQTELKHALQRQEQFQKEYQREEDNLQYSLRQQNGDLRTRTGELEEEESQSAIGGLEGRKWRIDDVHTPQPIQMHIECLRAIKEKLPRFVHSLSLPFPSHFDISGEYVLLVSIFDRLGGHPMRWRGLTDFRRHQRGHPRWQGATHPVVSYFLSNNNLPLLSFIC